MYSVLTVLVFGLILVLRVTESQLPQCPQVQCKPLPNDVCSEPNHVMVGETKCPLCAREIPCRRACRQPKQPGTCKAYMPSYYYDRRSQSCKRFIYGGCDGNGNRFQTLVECERKCKRYGK